MPTTVQEFSASTAATFRPGDDDAQASLEYFRGILAGLTGTTEGPLDVLDLGCGPGQYFHCYQRAARIVGVDRSPYLLAEAMSPYKKEEITASTITLTCAKAQDLPLPAGAFDFIASIGFFGIHAALTHTLIHRLAMALRPGGKLCLYVQDAETPYHTTTLRRLALACRPHVPPAIRRRLSEWLGYYAMTQNELTTVLNNTPLTEAQILRSRDIDPDRKIWRRMWFLVLATK